MKAIDRAARRWLGRLVDIRLDEGSWLEGVRLKGASGSCDVFGNAWTKSVTIEHEGTMQVIAADRVRNVRLMPRHRRQLKLPHVA